MNNIEVTFELDYNYGNLKKEEYGKKKTYTIQDLLDEIDYLYVENNDCQNEIDSLKSEIEELNNRIREFEEKERENE